MSCRDLTIFAWFSCYKNIRTRQLALLRKHSHMAMLAAPTIIRIWQSSNGPLAQSLCRAGKASRRITPIDLRQSSNSLIAASQEYVSMEIQSSTENKVAANNISHCTLVPRSFPSQQRQAPERACITFSKISNHIYDRLKKMLEFFPLVSCTTILTCGR